VGQPRPLAPRFILPHLFSVHLDPVDQDTLRRLPQVGRLLATDRHALVVSPSIQKIDKATLSLSLTHLVLLALAALSGRALLDLGCVTVEDEHGPHAVKEQLSHAMEGAHEVRVADHVALVVAHGLDELREPDARVHRQRLARQRLELHLSPHGRQQHPQILHAHAFPGLLLRYFLLEQQEMIDNCNKIPREPCTKELYGHLVDVEF
jgi:hypothetical protein